MAWVLECNASGALSCIVQKKIAKVHKEQESAVLISGVGATVLDIDKLQGIWLLLSEVHLGAFSVWIGHLLSCA